MLTKDVIKGFVGSVLVSKFDGATAIPKCHEEWWELCCSDEKYIAIAAPRNHAKSTAITFSFLLSSVLFRQSQFVLLVSDTETQASMFLGDIKQELSENDDLISLFGVKRFVKYSETDIIVEMDDGYRFRIIAKGAEQKLRGLKWNNKRPDLIVCDDLENDEIVRNQERRENFRRWFTGALLPCKAIHGRIIIVGTILHMDSLLERFMPVASSKNTVVEPLKQYSIVKKGIWKSVKYKAHSDDFSKLLWPERYTKDYFKRLKESMTNDGMADIYSQEYLNYPIDENSAYFRRDDFLPYSVEDLDTKVVYYSAVDFAISTSETSDYTVIATVGVTPTGDILVKDIRRGRWDSAKIIEEMFFVHKRYRPDLFVVEQGAIQKAIGPFLNKEMQTRGTYLNLYPVVPTKDKISRARSLQGRLRSGGIRFDKDASWYPVLEDEMARFPRDKHDDQVDALAWIGLTLDKLQEALTPEEEEEMEYNELIQSNDYFLDGRNFTTGY